MSLSTGNFEIGYFSDTIKARSVAIKVGVSISFTQQTKNKTLYWANVTSPNALKLVQFGAQLLKSKINEP